MTTFIVIGSLVAVGLLLFGTTPGRRILAAISGQFSKWSKVIWRADPVAVLQGEIDKYTDQVQEATKGLEEYNGRKIEAARRVETASREVVKLTVKVKTALESGDEERATEHAVLLKKAEDDLEYKKKLQTDTDATYEASLKKIKYARKKIQETKERADKLQVELKMSKVDAQTAQLAQQLNVKDLSCSGLGEIEDEIQRQIDTNRGRAQVARDLSVDGLKDMEEEEKFEKEEAKSILDRFRTKPTENQG